MSKKSQSNGQNHNGAVAALHITATPFNQMEKRCPPSQEEISRRAYFSYVHEGSKPGHDIHHWLEAEADLLAGCALASADNVAKRT